MSVSPPEKNGRGPASAGHNRLATHEVVNQVPPLEGHNWFEADLPLVEGLEREGGGWARDRVSALGAISGDGDVQRLATEANENPPKLQTHARTGERIDEVDFHPSWHELMRIGVEHGVHAMPWREPQPGVHVARAALMAVLPEAGVGCPISMTYAGVPALRKQPDVAAEWEPRLISTSYDRRFVPSESKAGAVIGMAMTEKQGGSDVRANQTVARPLNGGGSGAEYELTGHKWFCSAPMSDAFLVLAQAPGGLSCFLLPRWTPDGERNRIHLQRLKDKLGNRSNASSEVEFDGAWSRMIGDEGRGVPTIIEMVNHTRLDCVLGSATLMRRAVEQAAWHAAHRSAFGKLLAEQPLMATVIADLHIEAEAATATAMRLARSFDNTQLDEPDEQEELFKRIASAVSKYWVCKRGPMLAAEALECLGGNGYVEASGMPRLYREAPLMSIWEGSGNVICLDVLRGLAKTPATLGAFFAEVEQARGSDARLDAHIDAMKDEFTDIDGLERRARRVVESMALALQGSLLVRHAPAAVADAFCASRLARDGGFAFGTLPTSVDIDTIVARATPALAA